MNSSGLLLDTCAVIYRAEGFPITARANDAIAEAARAGSIFISVISAWEIGLLTKPERRRPSTFLPNPKAWFARAMAEPGVSEALFTAEIAIDAFHLPRPLHGDPADHLLIATARALGVPIVTRDDKIIAYAHAGNVNVIPC